MAGLVPAISPRKAHSTFLIGIDGGLAVSGRPGDDGTGYCFASARNLKRWILPVAVFGRSLRNSIQRGYL